MLPLDRPRPRATRPGERLLVPPVLVLLASAAAAAPAGARAARSTAASTQSDAVQRGAMRRGAAWRIALTSTQSDATRCAPPRPPGSRPAPWSRRLPRGRYRLPPPPRRLPYHHRCCLRPSLPPRCGSCGCARRCVSFKDPPRPGGKGTVGRKSQTICI